MKVRKGFVSNSSSSSFLVWGDRKSKVYKGDVPSDAAIEIDKNMAKILIDDPGLFKTIKGDIYLTPFLSDAGNYTKPLDEAGAFYKEYQTGNHGGPYDEEDYVHIGDVQGKGVWILKDHYKKWKEKQNESKNRVRKQ